MSLVHPQGGTFSDEQIESVGAFATAGVLLKKITRRLTDALW